MWDLKFTSQLPKMGSRAPAAAPASDVQQMQLWALAPRELTCVVRSKIDWSMLTMTKILSVLEPRVASVGHLRPELLPVRGSPFWKFAGTY